MSSDTPFWKPDSFLAELSQSVRQDFILKKRVLSFEEYFSLVAANPRIHARSAAQYLVDCFSHFGTDGERFRLFDAAFDEGTDRLVGQERTQQEVFRILSKYARQGKVDHLVLLHGPNGSAKSTLIACIARALEFYSASDDGALYRFNWIFPSNRIEKKSLGFGTGARDNAEPVSTFAYLEESEIEAKISTEFKDHPLYLIPKRQRRDILRQVLAGTEGFTLSETVADGDLSPLNRAIFDSLVVSCNGDLTRVLRHVQVERFFLSRRFRRGLVTVEPQLQVDASMRQITLNRSLESLPKVLQNMTLFEPYGDLVDGNRGMVEYNDLLKKPLEAFKYLLATCEKSTVTLPSAILHLDTVFIASSNDRYLRAFLEHPDWPSFKGRIELVRVPYLLDYSAETRIYESQIRDATIGRHLAPHTMRVAGLFAVLSRLVRPNPAAVAPSAADAVGRLAPIEKADLYASSRAPDWADLKTAAELKASREALFQEGMARNPYEGEIGASPREIKQILYQAAVAADHACLSPLAVLGGLERLLQEQSIYEFLRVTPDGGYQDHPRLIEAVSARYLEWADGDVRRSMGLAAESQHEDILARYTQHAKQVLKGEKIRNPITGNLEDPDTRFLQEIEQMLDVQGDVGQFRSGLIGTIGAWSLGHPGEPVPYPTLFQNLLKTLRQSYFQKHRETIRRLATLALARLSGDTQALTTNESTRVDEVITNLKSIGYCDRCASEVLEYVLQKRYAQPHPG
jgi:predicted Ser/Thr protein kinase